MNAVRVIALVVHVVGLVLGAFFAAVAIGSVLENFESDSRELALSRIATAAALVIVLMAFGFALVRRGFVIAAPAMFALSFGSVGFIVAANTRIMAKHFAPAGPEELDALYSAAAIEIGVVSALALLCWVWTVRNSQFPLLK